MLYGIGRTEKVRWPGAWIIRGACLAVLLMYAGMSCAGEVWINVETRQLTLFVMDGDEVIQTFENIAIGRNGTSIEKTRGDKTTPLGNYRVTRIDNESRFHLFIGLDYPTMDQATRALRAGLITADQWMTINAAHQRGREPPADTPLGGFIGIHGTGDGDLQIHQEFNWTDGCVALTDEQIDDLVRWIRPGMRVEFH